MATYDSAITSLENKQAQNDAELKKWEVAKRTSLFFDLEKQQTNYVFQDHPHLLLLHHPSRKNHLLDFLVLIFY